MMVVNLEVARADLNTALFTSCLEREEFLEDEQAVFEVRVRYFKSQLNEHVVVLVVCNAEAVPFEHLAVGHAAIAKQDLRALREAVLTSGYAEGKVDWNGVNNLVPDGLRLISTNLDLFCVCLGFLASISILKLLRFDSFGFSAHACGS